MTHSFLDAARIFDKPIHEQNIVDIMGRRPRLLVVDDQAANVQVIFKAFQF